MDRAVRAVHSSGAIETVALLNWADQVCPCVSMTSGTARPAEGASSMKKLFSLFSGLLLLLSCLAPTGSAQSINPGTEIQVQLLGQFARGKTATSQEFSATLAEPLRLE